MLRTIVILVVLAGAVVGKWSGQSLKVRFGPTLLGMGTNYFRTVPTSLGAAVSASWQQYTPPSVPTGLESLVMYCPSDQELAICAYYDDTGCIAGLLYSFNKKCYEPALDMAILGYSNWTATLANGTQNEFYSIGAYYVNATYLAQPSTTRIANRNASTILQCDKIWVTGTNGELTPAPTRVSDIANTNYVKQACIPGMGHHWHYNMSKNLECKADTLKPFYLLEYANQLVGTGLIFFNKHSCDSNWVEFPNILGVKYNLPDAPACLFDLINKYGIVSVHTYVVDTPYLILCGGALTEDIF